VTKGKSPHEFLLEFSVISTIELPFEVELKFVTLVEIPDGATTIELPVLVGATITGTIGITGLPSNFTVDVRPHASKHENQACVVGASFNIKATQITCDATTIWAFNWSSGVGLVCAIVPSDPTGTFQPEICQPLVDCLCKGMAAAVDEINSDDFFSDTLAAYYETQLPICIK